MMRWSAVAPLVLVAASGCLATKSDIQLLQTEARTSRSQSAEGVAAILRADSVRGRQIAQLSATLDRLSDSVRTLTARFAAFQATANGEFATMQTQLVQFQALLGQTTRSVQDTRAQIEALREQGIGRGDGRASADAGRYDASAERKYARPGDAVHDGQRAVEGRELSHGTERVRVAAGDVPDLRECVGRASQNRRRIQGRTEPHGR